MAMVMALTTTSGCRLSLGHGRRLQLVIILVFVFCTSLLLEGVHCDATTQALAPSSTKQYIPIYRQNEADALNAILANWSTLQNFHLSGLLNWTSDVHPCEILSPLSQELIENHYEYEGAWIGVWCTPSLLQSNATGDFVEVSVTSLVLYGGNSSCVTEDVSQCGFQGITGELPIEISNLINLHTLNIGNNPNLTGPVPIEIFQMPNLQRLSLYNNSLSGTLPSDVLNTNCSLKNINVSYNSFSGNLRVSPEGTLFCSTLNYLYTTHNQLEGLSNFENLKATMIIMNISYNNINGTFFKGPYFNPSVLDVSNNHLKNITFEVFNKSTINGSDSIPPLSQLFMQNNRFHGTVPTQILTSPGLNTLNCDQNLYEVLKLPKLQICNFSLSRIYLTNNQIKDVEYASEGPLSFDNLQFSNILFLGGNPYCTLQTKHVFLSIICRFNQSTLILDVLSKTSSKKTTIIATTISISFTFMILVGSTYIWRLMHRIESLRNILKEFAKNDVKPNLYSYKDIKVATNNFDKNNKLGEGGFGVVYKGELNDNTLVAVKKLTMSSHQVLSEFLHEVVIIAGLKHRNVVKLKGCCLGDGDQRMLVFEYVENKNLAEALWSHDYFGSLFESTIINWDTRFNIILGIARGLAYLHEDLQPPVIHRDIKAANILLDKDYNPKIADFGLAFLYPTPGNEASHLTLTQVAGTRGYCSLEYALHGHISTSIDVYSFGIVTLEVVSGRRNIDSQKPNDEIYLREWAWKQYEGQTTMTLIDPKMKHSPMDVEVMLRVISVALMCVHYKPTSRPKMHDVVSMLCGKMIIDDFSRGFEYGETLEDVTSNFYMASGSSGSHYDNNCLV